MIYMIRRKRSKLVDEGHEFTVKSNDILRTAVSKIEQAIFIANLRKQMDDEKNNSIAGAMISPSRRRTYNEFYISTDRVLNPYSPNILGVFIHFIL